LIHTIKSAGERKKWREVIQLGRALEKFMIFYKRWQTWSDILNLILKAAKALNDSKIQAWALHQLGSRALYLGYASEAKTFLSQALNIRQAIGDKAGLAITQHNINTLNGIIAPLKGNASGCRKYLTFGCGCGTAAGLAILAVTAWLIFNFIGIPGNIIPPTEIATIHPSETPALSKIPSKTPSRTPSSTPTRTPTKVFTPTAIPEPIIETNNYNINVAGGEDGKQRSKSLDFTIAITTVGMLQIEYSVGSLACSDIYLHILLDNSEIYTSDEVGPVIDRNTTGLINLGPQKGNHKLTLSPEGIFDDSCNVGTLTSWGGTLTVYTSRYP
jgi:hypothetical protein